MSKGTTAKMPKDKTSASHKSTKGSPAEGAKRGRGRPRKVNPAESGKYARFWADGVLDQQSVAEHVIRKHHVRIDDNDCLWYYEPSLGLYRQLTKHEGGGAPRRTIKAILGNKYRPVEVNNIISGILEDKADLERIETARTTKNAHLVYLRNGRLDVRTDAFEPYTALTAGTYQLPITYDPAASCGLHQQQFSYMMAPDAKEYVYEALASIVIPSAKTAAIWILGTGTGTGKSTFIDEIEDRLLGSDFVSGVSPHQINGNNSHLIAGMQGKLLNVSADLSRTALTDLADIKKMVSEGMDSITAHAKYGHAVKFKWFGSMVFAANQEVEVADEAGAWNRRVRYLSFPNRLEAHFGDMPSLSDLYSDAEISGLFNEIVSAAKRLQDQGFTEPESAKRMRREFSTPTSCRPIVKWMHREQEAGMLKIDRTAADDVTDTLLKVKKSAAWKAFTTWATAEGISSDRYAGRNEFYQFLTRTFGPHKHTEKGDYFVGLQLTGKGERRVSARALNLARFAVEQDADLATGEIA